MFGYVVINKPELKIKDFDLYHEYYCGLCKTLKKEFGIKSQLALSNDMNFINILLSGLYEPEEVVSKSRCVMHPTRAHQKRVNEFSSYCAKMTIVLTYFKCDDDYRDDNSHVKNTYKHILQKSFNKVKKEYPHKVKIIEDNLNKINHLELEKNYDLDLISSCFGKIMAEICLYQEDSWHDELYDLGFYLGKFIYLIDAYDDIEDDLKNNSYNPFINSYTRDDFDDYCHNILEMMISNSSVAFERLPIIKNSEIIRNIIYSGVWSKYELVRNKRNKEVRS